MDYTILTAELTGDPLGTCVEDNTGACDGNVYVYVCRDTDGTNYEDFTADDENDAPALACVIDPVQNKTKRKTFFVDAGQVSSFKVAVDNDCGQESTDTYKPMQFMVC